ncbi:MAG: response regulator transcription factor [bacterium]
MAIRVAIVEDNAPIRQLLSGWIKKAPDMTLASIYPDAESILREHKALSADVILMDINMPGMNGVECVRALKPLLPDANFVMLTVYHDAQMIFDALSAGASGYLLKRAPREELLTAIRNVAAGGSPMSAAIAAIVVEAFKKKGPEPSAEDDLDKLTAREYEVLSLLAQGLLYKEIADQLSVSFNTVNTLARRIYDKLRVHTRRQAIQKFNRNEG